MAILKQSTTYNRKFLLVQSSDHITALTGSTTVSVSISKSTAAFGGAGGAVTEIGNGWYNVAFTASDTGTVGDLSAHATATSADPTDWVDQVQAQIFTDVALDAFGNVSIASSYKKNQTAVLPFVMTLSGTNGAATGKTITAQRSLAGAGFAPCANSVTEVGNGGYVINLAATDTNASVVYFRFTEASCNDQNITLYTQP